MSKKNFEFTHYDINLLQKNLPEDEFASFSQTITSKTFPIFEKSFPNIEESYFRENILMIKNNSNLQERLISTVTDKKTNNTIGFVSAKALMLKVSGKKYLFTIGSGYVLEEYRKRGLMSHLFFKHGLKIWRNGLIKNQRMFALSICSPSMYHLISQITCVFYPSHNRPMTTQMDKIYEELKKELGYKSLPDRPYVIGGDPMWKRSESKKWTKMWKEKSDPHAQYFMDTCSDYIDGNGILTVFPVNSINILFFSKFMMTKYCSLLIKKLRKTNKSQK